MQPERNALRLQAALHYLHQLAGQSVQVRLLAILGSEVRQDPLGSDGLIMIGKPTWQENEIELLDPRWGGKR